MGLRIHIFIILLMILFYPQSVYSQQQEQQRIEEILTRLEIGQQRLEKKIEQLQNDFNVYFDEIAADMNRFFIGTNHDGTIEIAGALNRKFKSFHQRMDEIESWLHAIIITVIIMFVTIIIQILIMLKKPKRAGTSRKIIIAQ